MTSTVEATGTGRAGWRSRPPGPAVAVLTLIAMVMLLCVRYDWWPLNENMTNDNKLALTAISAVLILASGIVWMTRSAIYILHRRTWSWRIAIVPAIGVIAIGLALVPGPSTFDEKKPEFVRLAQQIEANPGSSIGSTHIGTFDIKAVRQRTDGAIYFYNADAVTRISGWIYTPNHPPSYYNFTKISDLGDGWYRFTADP